MGLLPLPPSLNLQLGVGKELAFWSLKERLDYKLLFSYLGKLFHPLNFWPFFYGCKEIMALLCGNSQDSVRRGLIVTTIYESSPPPPTAVYQHCCGYFTYFVFKTYRNV